MINAEYSFMVSASEQNTKAQWKDILEWLIQKIFKLSHSKTFSIHFNSMIISIESPLREGFWRAQGTPTAAVVRPFLTLTEDKVKENSCNGFRIITSVYTVCLTEKKRTSENSHRFLATSLDIWSEVDPDERWSRQQVECRSARLAPGFHPTQPCFSWRPLDRLVYPTNKCQTLN